MGIQVKSVNGYVSDARGNAASNESGVVGTAMASSHQRSMAGMHAGRVLGGIVAPTASGASVGRSDMAQKLRERAAGYADAKPSRSVRF